MYESIANCGYDILEHCFLLIMEDKAWILGGSKGGWFAMDGACVCIASILFIPILVCISSAMVRDIYIDKTMFCFNFGISSFLVLVGSSIILTHLADIHDGLASYNNDFFSSGDVAGFFTIFLVYFALFAEGILFLTLNLVKANKSKKNNPNDKNQ